MHTIISLERYIMTRTIRESSFGNRAQNNRKAKELVKAVPQGLRGVAEHRGHLLALNVGLLLGRAGMPGAVLTALCLHLAAPPTVRIVHSGLACNIEEERYSERVYTIREGETLELTCLVTGHPRPQVSPHPPLWDSFICCCAAGG